MNSASERRPVGAWLWRFALVYIVVYQYAPTSWLVDWLGQDLLGLEYSWRGNGSGDKTVNYLQTAVNWSVASLAATIWWALGRMRPIHVRLRDLTLFLIRWHLGITMLTYGWIKVFPLQMPPPGPDRLIQSFGDASPMGLVWTFMGASVAYEMFAGLAELIGGYLLFWRRTAVLGALVTAGAMANVMALNFFYDVPVKLFSTHLFLMAIMVASPNLFRILGYLTGGRPGPLVQYDPWYQRTGRFWWMVLVVHLGIVGMMTYNHVSSKMSQSEQRAEPKPLTAIWIVEEFQRGELEGRALEDSLRWVRVGINQPRTATIQRATGVGVRMLTAIDDSLQTISFYDRGGQPPDSAQFRYHGPEGGRLTLTGFFEGDSTRVVMRADSSGALLTSRGFRWINEYPFNR